MKLKMRMIIGGGLYTLALNAALAGTMGSVVSDSSPWSVIGSLVLQL